MKLAIALFTRFARGADHAGEFLLRDRQGELILAIGQFQQALGRPTGHVEEHRVGQRLVGHADSLREQVG